MDSSHTRYCYTVNPFILRVVLESEVVTTFLAWISIGRYRDRALFHGGKFALDRRLALVIYSASMQGPTYNFFFNSVFFRRTEKSSLFTRELPYFLTKTKYSKIISIPFDTYLFFSRSSLWTCAVPRGCAHQVRSCDRSVSVVAGARISILSPDRISPAPANYTRQLSERDLAGRSIGRLARVNVEPLRVPAYASLSPRYPSHHSSFRGSYLRVTLRWPLMCASCVCRTTVYSRRETASTSLIVIAILDPLEHAPSTVPIAAWFTRFRCRKCTAGPDAFNFFISTNYS